MHCGFNEMLIYVNQDATRKALLSSLHKDPHTSWVKGPSGKHTNVSALLDWPDDSDDSDPEMTHTATLPSVAITTAVGSHGDSIPTVACSVGSGNSQTCSSTVGKWVIFLSTIAHFYEFKLYICTS